MLGWLDSAGPVLFDATLSTALFLSLVVVAMLFCQQPTRRLLIGRLALIASLAMIPLVAFVPWPRVDLLNTLVQADVLPTSLVFGIEKGRRPTTSSVVVVRESRSLVTQHAHDSVPDSGRWISRSLIVIDGVCIAVGMAWLLLGCWGVNWLIRRSQPPSAETAEIFDQLLADGKRRLFRPLLRVTSRVRIPVVVGFLRPTILIPPSLDEPDSDTELLRLSLLHEIAHGDQSDPLFGVIASAAQTVWFSLPPIWWIRSHLILDQEFLADRSAALRYGTSFEYVSSLLALAKAQPAQFGVGKPTRCAMSRGAFASHAASPLSQRVRMLLHCPFRVEAHAPRSWSWILRFSLLAAMIVAACLCIRWPNPAMFCCHRNRTALAALPRFRVADFTAEPVVYSKDGQIVSYVMPVALPSRFVLSVEVLSTLADLEQVRIAGHSLVEGTASEWSLAPSDFADQSQTWHRVRLARQAHQVSLTIDAAPAMIHLSPQVSPEWLTFEPSPARITQFRNLVVEW